MEIIRECFHFFQVISYRQMLVPSRYFGRDTNARRLQSTGDYCEAEPVPLRQSNVMSRCLHYDSASHRGAVRPASPLAESAKPDAEEGVVHLASNFNYHPSLLDDPELIAGKHSTLLTFPSYMVTSKQATNGVHHLHFYYHLFGGALHFIFFMCAW